VGKRISEEQKAKVLEYVWLSPMERMRQGMPITLGDIAKVSGVSITAVKSLVKSNPSFIQLNRDEQIKEANHKRKIKIQYKREVRTDEDDPENYDSFKFLNSRSKVADKALLDACEKGNANALRTFYQLTRKLEDKVEVNHKFDGSFITRAILQAERELNGRTEDNRMGEVQEKSTLLRQELCLPSGQDKTGNDTLDSVASPVEGNRPVVNQENDNNSQGQTTGN
jgi:hypothetical protein